MEPKQTETVKKNELRVQIQRENFSRARVQSTRKNKIMRKETTRSSNKFRTTEFHWLQITKKICSQSACLRLEAIVFAIAIANELLGISFEERINVDGDATLLGPRSQIRGLQRSWRWNTGERWARSPGGRSCSRRRNLIATRRCWKDGYRCCHSLRRRR